MFKEALVIRRGDKVYVGSKVSEELLAKRLEKYPKNIKVLRQEAEEKKASKKAEK